MAHGVYTIPFSGLASEAHGPEGPVASPCQPPAEFVVGPENHLAAVAVERSIPALASGRTSKFNPLVLYGPPGSGKSHLARGLARCCRDGFGRWGVVCLPAVEFAQALRDALEINAVDQWRSDIRRTRLLVIEDLHQLKDKLAAQQELMHTCDAMLADGQQVLVTMQQHPSETAGLLRPLAGRLAGGLTLPLSLPGRDSRLAILSLVASSRGVEFSAAALEALADGLPVSARELAGAILQLEMTTSGAIGIGDVASYVAGAARKRTPTLREIAAATARRYSLRISDLRSHSRERSLVAARGVAMLLARETTGNSLRQIGGFFGGRDHTTVLHACRRTQQLARSDAGVGHALAELRRSLTRSEQR